MISPSAQGTNDCTTVWAPSQGQGNKRRTAIRMVALTAAIGQGACATNPRGNPATDAGTAGARAAGGDAAAILAYDAAESGGNQTDSGNSDADLRTNVAPGGNFDLAIWELQEPIGSPGNPTTIAPAELQGPGGFQDSYFFTDPVDGAMTFWDPEDGVTTPDSSYPRSELREMNADGSEANWPVAGTNVLSATVAVTQVPDHVCIGQIHIGSVIEAGLATSTKPLLELYYYSDGSITLGIENSPTGGQTAHPLTSVALGTTFTYTIELTGDGTITVAIDGVSSSFTMPSSFDGYGEYFKAGDYDQTAGDDAAVGAKVKFYALQVSHTST